VPTITFTVTLSGPDAEATADRVAQAISELDNAATLSAHPVLIDTPSRQVYVNGEPSRFTRREYDLLLFLTNHSGSAFTRLQLLRAVWGHEFSGERTVDVHVRRIRMKLRRHGDVLATVHGFGYRLENSDQIFVVQTR
jgi:DNA-binding response OmpR family regulator